MTQRSLFIAGLAFASALVAAGAANAAAMQDHHRPRHVRLAASAFAAPPLTVQKRSFLDPGNVVPVGSTNDYFVEASSFALPITSTFAPDRYGEAVLPGRFDLPNNPRFQP